VLSGVTPALIDRLRPRTVRVTAIDDGRYALELKAGERPEPFVADASGAGAALVSVTPLGATLEEVFVERVGASGSDREVRS